MCGMILVLCIVVAMGGYVVIAVYGINGSSYVVLGCDWFSM